MTTSIRLGPIATAAPPGILDRAASLQVATLLTPADVPRAVLARLHERVGIQTRNVAVLEPDGSIPLYGIAADPARSSPRRPTTAERMRAYAAAAPPIAIEAARDALRRATVEAGSITHLVTASCTGFGAPGVDLAIVQALGLPSSVQRTHVARAEPATSTKADHRTQLAARHPRRLMESSLHDQFDLDQVVARPVRPIAASGERRHWRRSRVEHRHERHQPGPVGLLC